MNLPVEMTVDECLALLETEAVGRVAVATPLGPRIVPVNYVLREDAIVFRTAPYSQLATHAPNSELAFEVDYLDHQRRLGWSVVVLGRGQTIEDPEEVRQIRSGWDPHPWADGLRNMYVKLTRREVTGRRLTDSQTSGTSPIARRAG